MLRNSVCGGAASNFRLNGDDVNSNNDALEKVAR